MSLCLAPASRQKQARCRPETRRTLWTSCDRLIARPRDAPDSLNAVVRAPLFNAPGFRPEQ